ncbi:UNVERIFIED_CONTAM: Protein TIC, partial [Sesamum indicum]
IPSPILTKKLKETSKTEERVESEEERVESEEERDVEIETASEMKGTKQEQEDPPKKILPFFRKERRIQTKSMKRKKSESMERKMNSTFDLQRQAIKIDPFLVSNKIK